LFTVYIIVFDLGGSELVCLPARPPSTQPLSVSSHKRGMAW